MLDMLPALSNGLPAFYREVVPLTPEHHRGLRLEASNDYTFAAGHQTIPLTIDEFSSAQRDFPILFTVGAEPLPAVLMGVEPNANPYVDCDGRWKTDVYLPAYVRRYPFLLIRQSRDSDNFVLCIDRSAPHFATPADGQGNLFDAKGATDVTAKIMEFCIGFERGLDRTRQLGRVLTQHDLLVAPKIRITRGERSVDLAGFRIVSAARLAALADDVLAGLARDGSLAAIHAHLMSLSRIGQLEDLAGAIDALAPPVRR